MKYLWAVLFYADAYIGAGRQSFKQEKVKLARNPQRVHQNCAAT
jgi:hypothetical protein